MPWKAKDAERFTKRADTPELRKLWKSVANAVLKHTGDESLAVRQASSTVKRHKGEESSHWSKM